MGKANHKKKEGTEKWRRNLQPANQVGFKEVDSVNAEQVLPSGGEGLSNEEHEQHRVLKKGASAQLNRYKFKWR